MEIDLKDFVVVTHTTGDYKRMPNDLFRVNNIGLALSANVAKEFQDEEFRTRAYVTMRYSAKHQAFFLEKGGLDPYTFGISKTTGTARLTTIPKSFGEMKVPRGVYKRSEDNPNLFIYLAEQDSLLANHPDKVSKYITEDRRVEKGDIVCFIMRADSGRSSPSIGTGIVTRVWKGEGADEPSVTVEPISQIYKDAYPGRKTTNIKLSNLIIREKHDA